MIEWIDHLRFFDQSTDPGPTIVPTRDVARLKKSGNLFASKFDAAVDARALDLIDGWIDGQA